MFHRLLPILGLLLAPWVFCTAAQAQYPTQWHVNGNGYVGLLIYTVDPNTLEVRGTLLGTPCEGVLVGRRLILHRTPGGSQIWEGWIMDPQLGASGQPYYRGDYFIAGTISENRAGNSLYPWYGVPTSSGPPAWNTSGGQVTGGGGSQPGFTGPGQPGGTGGGSPPGYTGGGQPGFTGPGQPGGTGAGQPGYTGGGSPPGYTGGGQPGYAGGGNLVVNGSFEQGLSAGSFLTLAAGDSRLTGWTVTKGTVDLHGTYLKAGHGKQSIDLIGTPGSGGIRQVIHTVPGQHYRLSFLMAGNCNGGEPVKRMTVRVGGTGRSDTFDVSGHSNQEPGWVQRGFTFQANSSQTVLEFSDPGQPDSGERYGAALDNVAVVPAGPGGAQPAGGSQPGAGTTVIPGHGAGYSLSPDSWQAHQNGQSQCSKPGGQLCIDSMAGGGAYFTARRTYDMLHDYTVSFEVQLTEQNNHFPILYSDGFISVDIDWGTDLGHTQPGASFNLRRGLGNLEVGRWHTIRVDAHPSQRTFDLYLDGEKVSTATNVALPHPFHVDSTMPGISTEAIVIGDIDDVSQQGGAYNRGGVCWRNIRVSAGL